MSLNYIPDPYKNPVPVLLARVPETPEGQQWEPQRIRVLENAASIIVADNSNRVGGNAYNFTVKLASYIQNIHRVAVDGINFSPPAYNMNAKFNTIRVIFIAGPFIGPHTVQVAVGQYTTGPAAAAAIQAALAPYGMVVSWNALLSTFTITAADPFYIDPICPFIIYGQDFHGFVPSTTPTTSLTGEPAKLIFSMYYAISCRQLTQYQKNNSSASDGVNSDLIAFIINNTGSVGPGACTFVGSGGNLVWKNFEPQTQITYLEFAVRDRWGDDPSSYTNNANTWQCTVIVRTNT